MYIHPKNPSEKKENEETLLRAEQILSIRRAEYAQGKYGIKDRSKNKLLFLTYYDKLKEERYESKGNYDNWDAAQNHIEDYCKKRKITFEDIDEEFVLGFKKFLNTRAKTKSKTPFRRTRNTPIITNSKQPYETLLKMAIQAGISPPLLRVLHKGKLQESILRTKSYRQW